MKFVRGIALFLVVILALATVGCSGGGGGGDESSGVVKPITIKFGHNGPADPSHPQNIAANHFKKIVEERSNGAIKVEIYPAAQLGDARTMVEGIQMGTIEMGDIENGPMGRFNPAANLWDLPYLFKDLDHAHAVLDGPIGDYVKDKYLDIGIRIFAYNDGGFRYFTNNKRPIRSPEDMSDMKIRVMESEVMIASINAFGASAIPMAFGELYSALDQGVVDGQENPLDLIYSMKFYEVQKYLAMSRHFYYPRHYMISEKFYQTLSPEHQKLLEECAKEACEVQRRETEAFASTLVDTLQELGMEVSEVDQEAFAERAKSVYPKFYELIGEGDAAVGEALVNAVLAVGEGDTETANKIIESLR